MDSEMTEAYVLNTEINAVTVVDMEVDTSVPEEKSFVTLQSAFNDNDTEILENADFDIDEPVVRNRTKEEEQDLTNKFLSGVLTFSEYAAQYGESRFEDVCEDEENIDERPVEPGTSKKPYLKENLAELESLKETTGLTKKKSGKRVMRRKNELPQALKGLMGEANLRYARGECDTAIKMCFEVLRQFPWAPEPFETLASLYDEKGDSERSLQASLIAAHLNPRSSSHLWISLAERSEEKGDIKQTITCYSRAIKADKKDIDIHLKLVALFEKHGDTKSVLKCYLRLLRCVESHHGERLIEMAKMLAQRFHEENNLEKAKEALEIVFEKCSSLINSEMVNIMLEVLMGLKEYKACIDILVKFCGVEVEIEEDVSNNQYIVKRCLEPETIVIDIFAKLVIVIVHLQAFNLYPEFFLKIKEMDPEDAGDVYFDVAEALIAEGKFTDALELLNLLTGSQNYSLTAVWLRIAECLKALNRLEESVQAYMVVVEKAPQLLAARIAVSELLSRLGRQDQALEVLTQDEDSETLNPALLYEQCQLLQNMPEQKEQFVAVLHLFLSRHFAHINTREELNALTTLRSDRKRVVIKESKNFQKAFCEGEGVKGEFSKTFVEPSVEEEWHMFWSACEICVDLGRYDTLQRLAFSAQGSQKFTAKYPQEIDLLCLISCYYNCDAYFGYNMVRGLVMKNLNCEKSWNIFNMMILRADDSRHNRFLMRLLVRNPHHTALTILHANNCLVAGTYKYALSDYTSVFQKENSAMMAFLIGVTLCQMACQKFSAKKHSLVTQSVAYFWKYKELRGREGLQESHYNIGRAFHQLGLFPPAIHHYKKALEFKSKFIDDYSKYLNLQREAAFNLHLIYMSSGARDVARMYLEKYIVI